MDKNNMLEGFLSKSYTDRNKLIEGISKIEVYKETTRTSW